uniref:Exostosin-2 n=1 Tax=Phallusia mammillata TaxID=59560 RepID=A0A6F9DCW1_9ASCI|nr:exostosin-2-like [Phallusia mammillata]
MAKSVVVPAIISALTFVIILYLMINNNKTLEQGLEISSLHLDLANNLPKVHVDVSEISADKTDPDCKMYNCFDIYRCGMNEDDSNDIKVYVYPLNQYVDENGDIINGVISKEFYELYTSIVSSRFYTNDPSKACLFMPGIDLLNQNGLDVSKIGRLLASLPHWNHGKNHVLFNMLPGSAPEFSTSLDVMHGKAIVAGGGFSHWTYRTKFDISIPVMGSKLEQSTNPKFGSNTFRRWSLIAAQSNIHVDFRVLLEKVASENQEFLLLEKCRNMPDDISLASVRCEGDSRKEYPEVLSQGVFCLVLPTIHLGQWILPDALSAGCIPVIACDTYVLPFSEVLDWSQASVRIQENSLQDVMLILKKIPFSKIQRMQQQVRFFYENYFNSITALTVTSLQIISDRVFPHNARTYEDWNKAVTNGVQTPLSLPLVTPKEDGFTAVILAYDRVQSLFQLITAIDKVSSLSMILVVWNNQQKSFPARNEWPIIDHQWKVIQTTSNKLSNRFFPYEEIKTEAVLAIDDDIIMLTADEIEFGYQVWREFPDRVVGFPPRLHIWTPDNKLRYESEWKNNISIVLTGAAFYHNYFNYLYTYKMPGDIHEWVDEHMNCEDIAMNFIVSNHTGKAPIKVTPRKKFKCTDCATGGSLSLDESHMVERTTCMNHFTEAYGMLPLKSINFRADPVLYKDDFPEKLKAFPDIGAL